MLTRQACAARRLARVGVKPADLRSIGTIQVARQWGIAEFEGRNLVAALELRVARIELCEARRVARADLPSLFLTCRV